MLAIDIDGTLADVASVLCSVFGLTDRDFSSYELPVRDVPWRQVFAVAPPYPGAAGAVRRLAGRYPALYLTARDPAHRDVTRRWLDRHGFPRLPLWFAGDKAAAARALGVRAAIEDAPAHVAALSAVGVAALIPAQPYNVGLAPRFDRWTDVPGMVAGVL